LHLSVFLQALTATWRIFSDFILVVPGKHAPSGFVSGARLLAKLRGLVAEAEEKD
jgi:hypothetical protein